MFFEKFLFRACLTPLKHCLNIDGMCLPRQRKCSVLKLSSVCCGEKVTLSKIDGCRHFENRLRSMGLSIGDTITVLNNSGPVLVAKSDNRIALGAGMAEKIIVTIG